MSPTIEAKVDEAGVIRPKEPIALPPGSRLLITVLSIPATAEGALLSEEALAGLIDARLQVGGAVTGRFQIVGDVKTRGARRASSHRAPLFDLAAASDN